jgi:hypothetical protein
MPDTTNRGFPYPYDTDPIDVAGDIQRLAESIDGDIGGIAQMVDRMQSQVGDTFIQSGNTVANPAYAQVFEIYFHEPFLDNPIVTVMNGAYGDSGILQMDILNLFPERFTVAVHRLNGDAVTSICRFLWIAHGRKVFT